MNRECILTTNRAPDRAVDFTRTVSQPNRRVTIRVRVVAGGISAVVQPAEYVVDPRLSVRVRGDRLPPADDPSPALRQPKPTFLIPVNDDRFDFQRKSCFERDVFRR